MYAMGVWVPPPPGGRHTSFLKFQNSHPKCDYIYTARWLWDTHTFSLSFPSFIISNDIHAHDYIQEVQYKQIRTGLDIKQAYHCHKSSTCNKCAFMNGTETVQELSPRLQRNPPNNIPSALARKKWTNKTCWHAFWLTTTSFRATLWHLPTPGWWFQISRDWPTISKFKGLTRQGQPAISQSTLCYVFTSLASWLHDSMSA